MSPNPSALSLHPSSPQKPATVQDIGLHPQPCLISPMLTLTAMSRGGLNWMWNAWWVLADSIVQRGSLRGEQRHCSSALIEFDSTTGGGKKNVLLLSFKTERGSFSVPQPTTHPPTSFPVPFFFSPCNETGLSFPWTANSPEITLRFIELSLGMTTEELHFETLWSYYDPTHLHQREWDKHFDLIEFKSLTSFSNYYTCTK